MGIPNNGQEPIPPNMPDNNQAENTDADNGGGGIRQWFIDSYNGLYKVVLEPSMPTRGQVYLVIFGAIIGLIWAWGLFPAVFTGANPNRLSEGAQTQWVRMIAVASYGDAIYNADQAASLLNSIPNPEQTLQSMIEAAEGTDREALQNLATIIEGQEITGTAAPGQNGLLTSFGQIIGLIVLIGIVVPIFTLVWRLLVYPNIVAGVVDNVRQATDKEYAEQRRQEKERIQAAKNEARLREEMRSQSAADEELGEPVMTQLSIYTPGRDYDESYEIELPMNQGGDFLGQSGAVIAEAVAPDPVAIEVWLFDMFTQQDLKKVFITEAGNNDPSIRGRIASDVNNPDTDIVVAAPGTDVTLDSEKLRLQGKMADVQVNDNGRFESFQLQMRAWRKDGASAGAGTGGASAPPPIPPSQPLPDYSDMEFDPPPQMPQGNPQNQQQTSPPPIPPAKPPTDYSDIEFDPPPQMPQGNQNPPQAPQGPPPPPNSGQQGQQPLQPPPLNPPSMDDDDDPFGGTGDFTPLGNRNS